MQLTLKIANGNILGRNTGTIRSLDDARQAKVDDAAEQSFNKDFATLNASVRELAGLDGGDMAVGAHARGPEAPQKPGWLESLLGNANQEYQKDLASYNAESAEWKAAYDKGGQDLAPEAGVVVTTHDVNRFAADAEVRFDPAMAGAEGAMLQGVEHAEIKYHIAPSYASYDESWDMTADRESAHASQFKTVSYNKAGSQEMYNWKTQGNDSGNIVIDHSAGTLTYVFTEAPSEYEGFMNM